MDLIDSIAPKSDQLNAEDLLSGPRTFTIREVRKGSSPEQPVNIELVEFPGRPFRPSKTVRRLLVAGWGSESDAYAGRRLTLYRDPTVRFGGDEVGGIRVSHMSHLTRPLKLALTVTRGKRAPHVVEPLPKDAPAAAPMPEGSIAPGRLAAIVAGLKALDITEPADMLDAVTQAVGRELNSARDLTADEGITVLAWIEAQAAAPASAPGLAPHDDPEPPPDEPPVDDAPATEPSASEGWADAPPVAEPGSGGRKTAGAQ